MKKLILTSVLTLFCILAFAKKIKGTIFFEEYSIDVVFNIPIDVLFKEPMYNLIQYGVTYYDVAGNSQELKPESVREIRFNYENERIRLVSKYNTLGIGQSIIDPVNKIFLKLEVDGNVQFMTCFEKPPKNEARNLLPDRTIYSPQSFSFYSDNCVLQKGNGPLKRMRDLYLKNDLAMFFSDCPTLLNKIESQRISKTDIKDLVLFYNNNCGKI